MSSTTIPQKKEQVSRPSPFWKFVSGVTRTTSGTILGITMVTSSIAAGGLVGLALSFRNLPDVRMLKSYAPSETSYVYDVKGKFLASIHGEANREVVPLNKISPHLKRAVMAIEDSHFYLHHGMNPTSIGRAIRANWEKGAIVEGGSTLTMQLVRNLFLTKRRNFSRKLAELVLAVRVEQVFKKDEILEMYLNQVYWGHNNYGVETASRSFFKKSASQLNLAESAMLAGMIQAPEDYSPFASYKKAKYQQAVVLNRMAELGWITEKEAAQAKKHKILLGENTAWRKSELPTVTNAVTQELNERFGKEAVLKGGMRIQTTIDYKFQTAAEERIKIESRQIGLYNAQIALVAIDPRTHFVKAMVGGVDNKKSEFNRAIQSRRQPGSTFKPFVYYAAFAGGKYTPYSTVMDTPVRFRDGGGWYTPKNYGGGYSGAVSVTSALTQSLNVPVIRLGREVGLSKVIEICRSIGIKSPMDPVTSLPLGPIGLTPMEMAGAYATFASGGWYSEPTFIVRATDSSGNVILDNTPKRKLVLDRWSAASLTSVLKSVIYSGTGKYANIGRPAAGKTGTTEYERDVWFVGYVPQLATAVWVGKDNFTSMGKGVTGGHYAAPVWRDFMRQALADQPVEHFPDPSNFPRPKP